jgi:hypothetical protein
MTTLEEYQTLTDTWVKAAVESSANKAFGGDLQRTRQALRQGQWEVYDYMRHSLARQIGDYLGHADRTVEAVYMLEAAEPIEFGEAELIDRPRGIDLIVLVDRKTEALLALTRSLESSLAQSRRMLADVNALPECFSLDVHLVDDADVREQHGYGVLVNSVYVEPLKVWARPAHTPQAK